MSSQPSISIVIVMLNFCQFLPIFCTFLSSICLSRFRRKRWEKLDNYEYKPEKSEAHGFERFELIRAQIAQFFLNLNLLDKNYMIDQTIGRINDTPTEEKRTPLPLHNSCHYFDFWAPGEF